MLTYCQFEPKEQTPLVIFCNRNENICIQENIIWNVVCRMAAIWSGLNLLMISKRFGDRDAWLGSPFGRTAYNIRYIQTVTLECLWHEY